MCWELVERHITNLIGLIRLVYIVEMHRSIERASQRASFFLIHTTANDIDSRLGWSLDTLVELAFPAKFVGRSTANFSPSSEFEIHHYEAPADLQVDELTSRNLILRKLLMVTHELDKTPATDEANV